MKEVEFTYTDPSIFAKFVERVVLILILEWPIGFQEGSCGASGGIKSKWRGCCEGRIRSERRRWGRGRLGRRKISGRGVQFVKIDCEGTKDLERKIETHQAVLDRQRDSRDHRGPVVNMQISAGRSDWLFNRIFVKERHEKAQMIHWSLKILKGNQY